MPTFIPIVSIELASTLTPRPHMRYASLHPKFFPARHSRRDARRDAMSRIISHAMSEATWPRYW